MTPEPIPLFRPQAVDFHRQGGIRGDVLRMTPRALILVQWFVLTVAAVGLTFVCTAQVKRYATGPAVVLLEARHELTATRPGVVAEIAAAVGTRVRQGDVLVRLNGTVEESELDSIEREIDDQLILLLQQPQDPDARAAVVALRSRREVARAALERGWLRAPVDGDIVDLRARVGQRIEPGAALLALQGSPHGAELTALLPGPDRPRLQPGMPMRLRIAGFERTSLELLIEHVDEQVLGPREAVRSLGSELEGALEVTGPIVRVRARMASPTLRANGVSYELHHGMPAIAEVAIESEPLLYAWMPGLREALGDVF